MTATYSKKVRRPYVYMSSYLVNHLHLRQPLVVMWWSAALPGAGHMLLCKYFTGMMLILWEFVVNVQSHLNVAIMLSMTGHFEKAKAVLDTRWFFLYTGVYIFAMWDSYRLTIDHNKFYIVSDREDASILPVKISALENNYLDVRKPWVGTFWSLVTPGLGHLYINRLPTGFFILVSFMLCVYEARLLPAVQAAFYGNFDTARAHLNPEWLLFLPSIVGFASHDVYIHAKELNILFRVEQSRFLSDNYQSSSFRMPAPDL